MDVKCFNHFNSVDARAEVLLQNFDYYDGVDFIAEILAEFYGDIVHDMIDGIWFRRIEMHTSEKNRYFLEWHEDVGIYAYCNDRDFFPYLERRMLQAIKEINHRTQ